MPTIQEFRSRFRGSMGQALVVLLSALLGGIGCESQPVPVTVPSQTKTTTTTTTTRQQAPAPAQPAAAASSEGAPDQAPALSMDQLKSLVAPIALWPDPLLAQSLAASTYPLDLMEAQQWLSQNSSLKGDALEKAAEQQDWDPSVQSMVMIPDALKRMTEDVKWTTDLGNAFLSQESEVMDAVQALRMEAKNGGKLASTEQQTVETKVVESKTVVEIQPASTEVVYVPSYSPTVIWGAPLYPYPSMYYPPYYAGGALLSFGIGMAWGAAISGGWGWGCGWGGNNTININNNNNFNRNSNRTNNINRSGNSKWQHNAANRGGAPYKDRATANKYGGGARGDSAATRQSQARSRQSQSVQRGSNSALSNRSGGGGDRVGNRSVGSSNRGSSNFSGGSRSSGSRASASSARGSSSMGSRGGGGHRGGGGMSRGGGGRRR